MCIGMVCNLHRIGPPRRSKLIKRQLVAAPLCRRDQVKVVVRRDAAAPFPRGNGLIGQPKVVRECCHFWPDVRDMLHA